MRKITLICILLLSAWYMQGKPANPAWFRYVQPDGTVLRLQRHGDEWGHWTVNDKGQVMRQEADGYYRVVDGMTPSTASRLARIRRSAKQQMAEAAGRSRVPIALGQKHFLLVLVEFSDVSFTIEAPQKAIGDMLNQSGYSQNGAIGSARDYYFENSHGRFEPVFDVFGPVKLDKEAAYYGKNDKDGYDLHPEEAVRDACVLLDEEINFADYDLDGDSDVDLVYMVYAGKGEADGGGEDTIWPHQWYLYDGAGIKLTLDGKRVNRYACGSELNGSGKQDGIGTICHEFAHAIGLPDFYDTDYDTNGLPRTLESYSLMASGSYNGNGWIPPYFNMEERIMLGWLGLESLPEFPESGNYVLTSVQDEVAYKTPTDMPGEYFVYECRVKKDWDGYIPAAGLVVYHVDKSERKVFIFTDGGYSGVPAAELWSQWDVTNSINENGSHPCFYVVAAAAPTDVKYGMVYEEGYGYYFSSKYGPDLPFPGSKKVTTFTPKSWDGVWSDYKLTQIAYADEKVSFRLIGPDANILDYPVIANPGDGVYAAGSTFTFALDLPEGFVADSVKWQYDGKAMSALTVKLSVGAHTITAQVAVPDGKEMLLTLEIDVK